MPENIADNVSALKPHTGYPEHLISIPSYMENYSQPAGLCVGTEITITCVLLKSIRSPEEGCVCVCVCVCVCFSLFVCESVSVCVCR